MARLFRHRKPYPRKRTISGKRWSMPQSTPLQTPSANLKKAICWLSEVVLEHPEKDRNVILSEAELRFDLTPAECEFLNNNFKEVVSNKPCC